MLLAHPSPPGAANEVVPTAEQQGRAPIDVAQLFGTAQPGNDAARVEIALTLEPKDSLAALLVRAGVIRGEAEQAERMVRSEMREGVPEATEIAIMLGSVGSHGRHRLEALRLQTPARIELSLHRAAAGELRLSDPALANGTKVERFAGEISNDSFYWSLRRAGVPAEASDEFVRAVAGERHAGQFEAVVATSRRANGASAAPVLLYAAVKSPGRPDVRRVKWNIGTQTRWLDPAAPAVGPSRMTAPVHGRISSQFGGRAHPILRLFRFHNGIDIAATKGTPIRAAADGRVIATGWSGGYGQQVRIAHAGSLETSYSHMSAIAAAAGSFVRQGQVIGYVGSTGLSTGPHLHYELRRDGQLVDPLSVGLARPAQLDARQRGEIARHMQQLLALATLRRA